MLPRLFITVAATGEIAMTVAATTAVMIGAMIAGTTRSVSRCVDSLEAKPGSAHEPGFF